MVKYGRKGLFRSSWKSWEEIPQENQALKQGWLAYHLAPHTQVSSKSCLNCFYFILFPEIMK